MSGGVDSTVSAVLLQEMGYEVVGIYMIMHNLEELNRKNIAKAKKVAKYLGIELLIYDIQDSFKDLVYSYFIDSYKEGLTPNPCVVCNRQIKFGKMVEFANSLNIEKIATGHYVRVKDGFFYKGKDLSKDQSYFLAEVKKDIVNRVIFPLGEWLKEDVKKFANNIEVLKEFAKQSESSEICFVENSYVEILNRHFNTNKPGVVKDINGKVVGEHKGYMHYTIGKRRGFFVKGAHTPHYVLDLDAKNNTLIVGTKDMLQKNFIKIANINLFINRSEFECEVKVRYRTKGVRAKVTIINNLGTIELFEPVLGIAKGQFAVFYDGDKLLGGGEIIGVLD
jgi:tRNA-specific 2-thiouridylase